MAGLTTNEWRPLGEAKLPYSEVRLQGKTKGYCEYFKN